MVSESVAAVVLQFLPAIFPTPSIRKPGVRKRLKPSLKESMTAFIDMQKVG